MLRKKAWLWLGIAGLAVLALAVGLLTVGCGNFGADSSGSIPKEMQGKWSTVDKTTGEETVLDLTSGSFESMPASGSAFSQKIRKTRSAAAADDSLWAERCANAAMQTFTDGYITVGLKGKTRVNTNRRTITITVTHIHGRFWNDIWGFMSNLMKCVLLHELQTSPLGQIYAAFGIYEAVNEMIESMFVPLGVNSDRWYSEIQLVNELMSIMRTGNENALGVVMMAPMVEAMFEPQTISYSLNDAGDVLTLTGTDGRFTVYEQVQIP